MHEPVLTAEEIEAFLRQEFPQMYLDGDIFHITGISRGTAQMRLDTIERQLRPGGTVSGPTLFTLADVSAYVVALAHVGAKALVLTTNLNINFLRRAEPGSLTCNARILKLGRRLVVVDLEITDKGSALVAQATATYSIPER